MKRPAIAILVLVNAALGSLLIWLWVGANGTLKNTTWTPPAAQKADYMQMLPPLPGNAPVDTSKFVAMLDRPLFMLTRRPPPPPPPPDAPAPVDTLSTARVSGVFSSSTGGGVIMNIGGKDRRVRMNEVIDGGWTLQSISGGTVTFAGGGQSRVLTLPRAALTTYSGLPIGNPVPTQVQPPAQAQPSTAQAGGGEAAAGAPGSAPPRSTQSSGRAVFGGSR